jgi:Tol biopolymer transport system component
MSLASGQRLGPYVVVSPIGRGGMGEVWRATDPKLQRDVAIKVLPADVARDPSRLARFEREAQLLASLNHPNIAAIHGLEEADGQPFLVLELVPGEDLAERLKRGPLPVAEALDVARQVATALEEAHERGVVHRDLKPANVKVTPEGQVKVLDFGLAKAWSPEATSGSGPDLSQSPTLAHTGTAAGVILGTAAYMSPEQARGKTVDKRADVWAFGALLAEMLTGRPLFGGETVSDVLAAVLTREPDWSALPASTPTRVVQLLRRCLERDPKQRLRDIGEARIALAPATAEPATAAEAPAAGRKRSLWVAPAVLAAALLAFVAGWATRRPPRVPVGFVGTTTTLRQLTFDPGLEAEPSFSPDGNYLAYTTNDRGSLDVAVMPLAGGDVRPLADSPADEAQPAWSPDGTRIAFVSARDRGGRLSAVNGLSAMSPFVIGQGGDLYIAPAAGGPAVKLVERGAHPAWSPDSKAIAFQSDRGGHWDIWTVPADGGEPRQLTDDAEIDYEPAWSPDGRFVAYAATVPADAEGRLRVVPRDGSGPPRELRVPGAIAIAPAWSPDGAWIYFASSDSLSESRTSLWRIAFATSEAERRLERLTLGEAIEADPAVAPGGGRLAYGRATNAPDVFELDVATHAVRQLTSLSCLEDFPDVAPDGRTLLFTSDRWGEAGLFTMPVAGGPWQRLSNPEGSATMGRWSPDGTQVAYGRTTADEVAVAVQAVGGLAVRKVVAVRRGGENVQAPEWSPDGRSLAFTRQSEARESTIQVVDLADGRVRDVAKPGGLVLFASWSPDGQRLAFQREAGGPRQIWSVPASGGEATEISRGNVRELSHPQWSPRDLGIILVVVDHKNLATLSVATGVVTPLTRYDDSTRYVDYPSWSPDGRKVYFSMTRAVGDLFLLENPTAAQ